MTKPRDDKTPWGAKEKSRLAEAALAFSKFGSSAAQRE